MKAKVMAVLTGVLCCGLMQTALAEVSGREMCKAVAEVAFAASVAHGNGVPLSGYLDRVINADLKLHEADDVVRAVSAAAYEDETRTPEEVRDYIMLRCLLSQ